MLCYVMLCYENNLAACNIAFKLILEHVHIPPCICFVLVNNYDRECLEPSSFGYKICLYS